MYGSEIFNWDFFKRFLLPNVYIASQVDLITTLTKLSYLGQKINYEAYTYPKQKINLGNLKL
jgi:hypothetical protein